MPTNPSEMLSSNKIKDFVNSLREHYDYIFIDAPPIGIVTDAGIISTYSDGSIFVVASGQVDIEMAKISKERLEKVGANILGVVLNKFKPSGNNSYYYSYYYSQDSKTKQNSKTKGRLKRRNT